MLVYEEYFNMGASIYVSHIRYLYLLHQVQNSSPFKYAPQLDVSTNYTVRSNILGRFLQQIEEIKNLTRFDLRWKFCDMLLWIDTFIFHSLPWLTFVSTT